MRRSVSSDTGTFASFENIRLMQDIASVTPITLDFCGCEQCARGYGYGPMIRPVYILHVVVKGRGKLEKGGERFDLEPGQAFLIYPGEENYYQADEEDPWKYMWIGFHGFHAEEMMQRAGFSHEYPVITCRNLDQVCAHMDAILKSSELTYVKELTRMSELYGMLSLLSDEDPEREESAFSGDINHQYVKTAVNLLMSAYGTQIRVADVAKTIGISRNYLDGIFKKEIGVSPKEFLMNFRMEKATALLALTENPIGVIAAEVGYSDPMTFSKVFRSRFHMSPTQFREARVKERQVAEDS